MRAIDCSSISATHPSFFPPRLEVAVFEQHADCLPTDFGNQLALHRFCHDEPHGPARTNVQNALIERRRNFVDIDRARELKPPVQIL
jgi:hypothetical protein